MGRLVRLTLSTGRGQPRPLRPAAAHPVPSRCRKTPYPGPVGQRGFSYLLVLLLVALLGVGLGAAGVVWRQASIREREAELLFVGDQFRLALASYARSTPVGQPRSPKTLDELLSDNRQPKVARHLRRIYRDPVGATDDWGLMLEGGRIKGIYSKAAGTPVKSTGFPSPYEGFANAATYAQWRFSAGDTAAAPAVIARPAGGTPPGANLPGTATGGGGSGDGVVAAPPPPPPRRSECEAALDQGMDNCARIPDTQQSLQCQEPVLDAWSKCENDARSRL